MENIVYGPIYKEDLALGQGTVPNVTMPDGSTQTLTKIGIQTFTGIYNVVDFGAVGDGITDNSTALQNAINAASAVGYGLLLFPGGVYRFSTTLVFKNNVIYRGFGKNPSNTIGTTLIYTGVGDAIQVNNPINSSTAANIVVEDMWITCLNRTGGKAAFADVGSSFLTLRRVGFSGNDYGVILDQSELAIVDDCDFESIPAGGTAGLWLVNGPAHTPGAGFFFTNTIRITNNQFNCPSGTYAILDDGGVSHKITGNNFNAGGIAIQMAGASGFVISDANEFESHTVNTIVLTDTITAGIVGPCSGDITGNYFGDVIANALKLTSAVGGSIKSNVFAHTTAACILFDNGANNRCAQIEITANTKLINGGTQNAAPFISGDASVYQKNRITQLAHTFVAAGAFAGVQTLTPATMEGIKVGAQLFCINIDTSNGEVVVVTAVTGSTFTATFASSKGPDFVVYGLTGENQTSWTPVLAGSSVAGANTYTLQTGIAIRKGNLVFAQCSILTSAVDAAMAGNLLISGLPYPADGLFSNNNEASATVGIWSGFTFAGYACVGGIIEGTESIIRLTKSGSGSTGVFLPRTDISSATIELRVSVMYTTTAVP